MALLYEYAVILNEKTDKDGDITEAAQVVVPPTSILARDQDQAQMMAARAIPEDQMDKLDRLMVVVRPF